ncbi:hypothetical protein HanPSC8_Chr16g0694211 [Helianthus annuus]|nr:hypothetical protein HanPSC8_Chr16g0694211 [Helianthus annuus]
MVNEVVFKSSRIDIGSTLDELHTIGFLWIKSRSKLEFDWDQWCRFNFCS